MKRGILFKKSGVTQVIIYFVVIATPLFHRPCDSGLPNHTCSLCVQVTGGTPFCAHADCQGKSKEAGICHPKQKCVHVSLHVARMSYKLASDIQRIMPVVLVLSSILISVSLV